MLERPVIDYVSRLRHVRASLGRKGIDGFLVTNLNNVRYLTGFSGSSALLLIARKESFFLTDFRYKEQSERQVEGWEIVIARRNLIKTIRDIFKMTGIKRVGFESSVAYDFFEKLSHQGLSLKAFEGFVEKMRRIKDAVEINSISEAVRRAESAFLEVKPHIKRGVTERAIALRLEERLKKNGCRRIPFDIIVASGSNSAMPHAKPTEKRLSSGDLVVIDWGGEANSYFSDITRTLLMNGNNVSRKKRVYQIVLKANKMAISQVMPGVRSEAVDLSAREVIKKKGYGEFFGHGTGHGVGLQVHESPRITWNRGEIIKEDMVFTIEPGIYVPGVGGVRIEDMVMVIKNGHEVLTRLPKELEII